MINKHVIHGAPNLT